KRGSDTKYLATVLAIGTECDIAHLTVNDDEFWEGVSPIEFGTIPVLQDAVTVVGYPIGGDTISVTSGVVSRIEILSYVHGSTELLGLQIDAAINSGNSGGPTFNDRGKCVGIAFQSLKHEDAENICYVIPTPVITHFIEDYKKSGEYTASGGLPYLKGERIIHFILKRFYLILIDLTNLKRFYLILRDSSCPNKHTYPHHFAYLIIVRATYLYLAPNGLLLWMLHQPPHDTRRRHSGLSS
ncbi:hypothetical protein ACJX0J_033731, partial [Zea mays]